MPTPFYRQQFSRRFPVSLLAMERLGELDDGSGLTETLCARVMRECCNIDTPEEDDYAYFVERVCERPAQAKDASLRPAVQRKTFGYALAELLKGFEPWEEMVAAFGLQEARRLYCEEDKEDAVAALSVWRKLAEGRHFMALEAASYGFGGGYKDDGAAVIDFSKEGGYDQMAAMVAEFNKGVAH